MTARLFTCRTRRTFVLLMTNLSVTTRPGPRSGLARPQARLLHPSLWVVCVAVAMSSCIDHPPGPPLRAEHVRVVVPDALDADVVADTLVILVGGDHPEVLFVPMRSDAFEPARRLAIPAEAAGAVQVRAAPGRIYLRTLRDRVASYSSEGDPERPPWVRALVSFRFSAGSDGRVFFPSSRYENFALQTAGPGAITTRPFGPLPPIEPPRISRARSGPGLEPLILAPHEEGGPVITFGNRSGILRTWAPDGSPLGAVAVPAELLAEAVPATRSAIGRAGAPLAHGLQRGCDGEIVLTLGGRRARAIKVRPDASGFEPLGTVEGSRLRLPFLPREPDFTTVCDGRVIRLGLIRSAGP
jgi:hypothetical protein